MSNNKILATVADREITRDDVEILIKGLNPQTAAQFDSNDGRKSLLEELISQELLYLDAVDKAMDKEEAYISEMERLKIQVLKQYALSKLINSITVEEEEILEYYNNNLKLFTKSESIRASHILIEDESKAVGILSELKSGLSFEDAALKYSSCPSKSEGGDLGYFTKGNMVPEFEKEAFELEIGEISSPVKTQFGYHIIKTVDKKEGGLKLFDEVKGQIKNQLILKKQQDLYIKTSDKLKEKYTVKIV